MKRLMNDYEKDYGEIIKVKVNGVDYPTYLDKNGVQRFIPNKIIEIYVRKNGDLFDNHKYLSNDELYTHNSIARDLYNGKVSFEDYLKFQTMHNASVDYFDSTVTQTLDEFFEDSDDWVAFEDECEKRNLDLDSDEAAYDECVQRHRSIFRDKYYQIDNPLWTESEWI